MAMREYYNEDCMAGMTRYPDNFFDLAIVDPPYGGGGTEFSNNDGSRFGGRLDKYKKDAVRTGGTWATKYGKKIIDWDTAPDEAYFNELRRVSKNQIIWGGNYFALPPCRCFLVWRKLTISENFTMAMAEYAWTSFKDNAKVFDYAPQGKDRFHPTQKPVALYKWILSKYAKQGDIILDTHVGSASSLIACEELGYDYVGFEIDEEYYKKSKARLDTFNAQIRLEEFL